MPSILAKGNRRVLRFFHKYSFKFVTLILYIINKNATFEQAVELEQYFIDILQPDLNADYVASSTGFHGPMSIGAREILRKLRGIPVYVYDIFTNSLIIIFDSKQHLTQSLGVDIKVLRKNPRY